jgi:hypothetical protein
MNPSAGGANTDRTAARDLTFYFTPIPIMWGGGASPAAFDFDLGLAFLRLLGSFQGVA